MEENEVAIAGLLYFMWKRDVDPEWSDLSVPVQRRWVGLARYVLQSEINLAARLADDRARKRINERLIHRMSRWRKEDQPKTVET